MTDRPSDETPEAGLEPTVERVRDALHARASSVEPAEADPPGLVRSIDADRRMRARRRTTIVGVGAAAALLLVVAGIVVTRGSDDQGRRVLTGAGSTTTSAGLTTTSADVATTDAPTSTTDVPTTTPPTVPSTTSAPAPTAAPTTSVPSALPGGSTDPQSGGPSGSMPALLTDVRLGCQGSVSRIVVELADEALPGWSVRYVDPPITEDASGRTVTVTGGAFLQIRLSPAWAHDVARPDAPPTYHGPTRLRGGCGSRLEAVQTGEFEAVTTWVVGVPAEAPMVVTHLSGPSRLVIDLAA